MFATKASAAEFVGGLSKPSKMPGKSFGFSARLCKTGAKLRDVEGSTCHKCYALKGAYTWKSTVAAHARRYGRLVEALHDSITRESWIAAMVKVLQGEDYFRWHDSGDIQSVDHLKMIADVARQTPTVRHWLPTREYKIVREFLKEHELPYNLVVRMSAQMIDAEPPSWPNTSTVHKKTRAVGHDCPARFQNNECGECRACWDPAVANVGYPAH
jgi:hypothetical protein